MGATALVFEYSNGDFFEAYTSVDVEIWMETAMFL